MSKITSVKKKTPCFCRVLRRKRAWKSWSVSYVRKPFAPCVPRWEEPLPTEIAPRLPLPQPTGPALVTDSFTALIQHQDDRASVKVLLLTDVREGRAHCSSVLSWPFVVQALMMGIFVEFCIRSEMNTIK